MNDILPEKPIAFAPAKIVYLLYLVSFLNGATAIIGVIIAYVYRDEAPTWLRSHFIFQIRTFWIGLLYVLIGALTTPIMIGFLLLLLSTLWLIVRCVKGFKVLEQQRDHPDPLHWGF